EGAGRGGGPGRAARGGAGGGGLGGPPGAGVGARPPVPQADGGAAPARPGDDARVSDRASLVGPLLYRSTPVRTSPAWFACQSASAVTPRAVSHPPSQQPVSMHRTNPRSRIRPSGWGVWPTTNTLPE